MNGKKQTTFGQNTKEKHTEIFLFNLLVSICDIFASKQNEITQNNDVFQAKILFETLEWNSMF